MFICEKNEKHTFTNILLSSCKGRVLSIQSIWKEATSMSLPTKNVS